MNEDINYKIIKIACYNGYLIQSIISTLTSILFIPLRQEYGLSYSKLSILVTINFIIQVFVDIIFGKLVDKYGFKLFAIIANIIIIIGQIIFGISPYIMNNCYIGFVIGTVLFSIGAGLLEILLSPIINSIPSDDKSSQMSILHASFSIGQFFVTLITTLFLYFVKTKYWSIVYFFWVIPPIIDAILFYKAPLSNSVQSNDDEGTPISSLLKKTKYWGFLLQIGFGSATETCLSEWISAFLEAALGINKVLGDGLGLCIFSLTHGISRIIFGFFGEKINLKKCLIIGSILSIICYIVISLSPWSWLNIVACGLSGFFVSLYIPGTLILTTKTYKYGRSSMFAFLSAAADIGSAFSGSMMGFITDSIKDNNKYVKLANKLHLTMEQLSLRGGFLISSIYPIFSLIIVIITNYILKNNINSKIEIELPYIFDSIFLIYLENEDKNIFSEKNKKTNEDISDNDVTIVTPFNQSEDITFIDFSTSDKIKRVN